MRMLLLAVGLGLLASALPTSQANAVWVLPWWGGKQVHQAEKLLLEGKYDEVIEFLSPEMMTKFRFRKLARAYLYLGFSYERTHRLDKALGVYQLGVRLFPKDVDLLTRLASLYHETLLHEQARPIFQRVLKLFPKSTPALLGLAEIDRSLGFLHQSAEAYEKALEVLPRNADLWRRYADVLFEQSDLQNAELAIGRSLELEYSPDSHLVLAFIIRGKGDIFDAADIVRILADKAPPERRIELALLSAVWHMEAGQFHNAFEVAERVLRDEPGHPLARYVRARAHLVAGRTGPAIRDLETAAAGRRPFVAKVAMALLGEINKGP